MLGFVKMSAISALAVVRTRHVLRPGRAAGRRNAFRQALSRTASPPISSRLTARSVAPRPRPPSGGDLLRPGRPGRAEGRSPVPVPEAAAQPDLALLAANCTTRDDGRPNPPRVRMITVESRDGQRLVLHGLSRPRSPAGIPSSDRSSEAASSHRRDTATDPEPMPQLTSEALRQQDRAGSRVPRGTSSVRQGLEPAGGARRGRQTPARETRWVDGDRERVLEPILQSEKTLKIGKLTGAMLCGCRHRSDTVASARRPDPSPRRPMRSTTPAAETTFGGRYASPADAALERQTGRWRGRGPIARMVRRRLWVDEERWVVRRVPLRGSPCAERRGPIPQRLRCGRMLPPR